MITITCTNNVRCELRRGAITGIVFNIQMWRAEKKGVIHTLGGIFKTLDYSLQIPDGKIPMFIEKFLKNKSIEPWSVESQMKPVPSIRLLVRSDKHSLTKTSRQHITSRSQPRRTAKKIKAIKKTLLLLLLLLGCYICAIVSVDEYKTSDAISSTALYIAPASVDWRVHPTL